MPRTKVKSSQVAVLLNCGTASSANYQRIGKGVSSLPISYGVKTTSETYVDEDNATTSVDGYEVGIDTEQVAMKGDGVFDYVDAIRRGLKTGSDCETDVVLVDIYNMTLDAGSGTGTGQKFAATIAISDFELNGGEIAKIKYKISLNGDPESVGVSIADKVVTVTAD